MRQAIRALGWATYIFWIILIFFTVTAVYSAFQLKLGFRQPEVSASDGTLTASFPFSIANGGLYDISNLNISTQVRDNLGSHISDSSTFVQLVARGSNVSITHGMSINISQMTAENLSYLLFNDSVFDVSFALKLDYANAVPFRVSTNFPMPWGAPLSNLTIDSIAVSPYNTDFKATVSVSFENHSPFSLDGNMRLDLVNGTGGLLGSGTASIPPQGGNVPLEIIVSDPSNIKEARLYFTTSVFSYGPVVFSLV